MNPAEQPEHWSRETLTEWQLIRLREMLTAIVPRNPWWTAKFSEAGIDPASISTLDDFRRLPVTSSMNLQQIRSRFHPMAGI
jgi:phenylacetate-CoA ligase